MKIGVNSRIYQNNETGIPYYIKCLYQALLKGNIDDEYVFFQTNKKKTLGTTHIRSVPNNILGIILFDGFIINKLAVSAKVDVVHGPSNVLPIHKNPKLKYVVTIHDLSFLVFPKQYSRLFNMYYKFIIKRSINNADIVIADSNHTKKDIKKFYKVADDKIKVIYLGVNPIFLDAKKTKRRIKEKYFFSITTHPKRKNIFGVLRAMSINKNLQGYKYVIVGSMSKKNLIELKQKINSLGLEKSVILFGYASERDLVNLYQNAEFFIYPSYYEGFGLPVLEAMASKCPVIVSNNSSLVEIVPDRTWSINPYDVNGMVKKMSSLLRLSKKQRDWLVNKNENFAKQFSWEKTAYNYNKIFHSL